MKKIAVILILILVKYSVAQHNIFIKAGSNVSWFISAENSKPIIGYTVGIDRGWNLYKKLNMELGIGYTKRGASLENQAIQPFSYRPINAYYWDIKGVIGYVDIPISFKYEFGLNRQFTISPLMGITFAIPVKDYSNFKKKRFYKLYDSDINDWEAYDYHFAQETTFGNNETRYIYELGIRLQYLRYAINIKYGFDKYKHYTFKHLESIKYKMNSFYVYFSYEL